MNTSPRLITLKTLSKLKAHLAASETAHSQAVAACRGSAVACGIFLLRLSHTLCTASSVTLFAVVLNVALRLGFVCLVCFFLNLGFFFVYLLLIVVTFVVNTRTID